MTVGEFIGFIVITCNSLRSSSGVKHWEIIADNLSKVGWSWGCVSALDANGRTIWIADEFDFPIRKICDNIQRGYFSDRPPEETELFDKILQLLKKALGFMCSYTHSGGLQLARRFTDDELKPNYSEGAIVEALNLVTVALLLLLHVFFVSMRCQKEDEETQTLLRQYRVDFGERLHALNTDESRASATHTRPREGGEVSGR